MSIRVLFIWNLTTFSILDYEGKCYDHEGYWWDMFWLSAGSTGVIDMCVGLYIIDGKFLIDCLC